MPHLSRFFLINFFPSDPDGKTAKGEWVGDPDFLADAINFMTEKLMAHYMRFVREEERELKVLEDEIKKMGMIEWYAKTTKTYEKGVIVIFCNEDKYSRAYVKEWNRYASHGKKKYRWPLLTFFRLKDKILEKKMYLVVVYGGSENLAKSESTQGLKKSM